jgi:hypothetical protein
MKYATHIPQKVNFNKYRQFKAEYANTLSSAIHFYLYTTISTVYSGASFFFHAEFSTSTYIYSKFVGHNPNILLNHHVSNCWVTYSIS